MRPHRFDPISFVFGLILTALAAIGLTDLVGLRFMDVRWIGPAVLVLVGLVLVLSAGRRRDDGDESAAAVDEAASADVDADDTAETELSNEHA